MHTFCRNYTLSEQVLLEQEPQKNPRIKPVWDESKIEDVKSNFWTRRKYNIENIIQPKWTKWNFVSHKTRLVLIVNLVICFVQGC